jgi:Holliday junction resolvase
MSNLKDILSKGEFARKPRVNSKKKGANFERKIATMLNERFKTTEFSRTPGSGAFGSTHQLPQHLIVHGDLITPLNFKYTIECKNGYNLELDDLFKPKSDFFKFIEQAKSDAARCSREWMVIYKKDRRKELVVVDGPLARLTHFVVVGDNYYVYLLKDVLALPEGFWFN